MVPMIVEAQVIEHGPAGGGVMCMFRSGQMFGGSAQAIPVRMSYDGYADPLCVHQKPLPRKGTWGLVALPHGDLRNATWLAAFYPNQQDAITSDENSPFEEYKADYSGHWSLLDGAGNYAEQWPDGSFLTVGAASGLPTLHRHTVIDGKQHRIPYPMSARVADAPDPFWFTLNQASGTKTEIDDAGNVTVSGAPNATLTMIFTGGTIKINSSGISFTTAIAITQTAGEDIRITAADGITASNELTVLGPVNAQGEVTALHGTGRDVGLSTHTTTEVVSGGDTSGPPTPDS